VDISTAAKFTVTSFCIYKYALQQVLNTRKKNGQNKFYITIKQKFPFKCLYLILRITKCQTVACWSP